MLAGFRAFLVLGAGSDVPTWDTLSVVIRVLMRWCSAACSRRTKLHHKTSFKPTIARIQKKETERPPKVRTDHHEISSRKDATAHKQKVDGISTILILNQGVGSFDFLSTQRSITLSIPFHDRRLTGSCLRILLQMHHSAGSLGGDGRLLIGHPRNDTIVRARHSQESTHAHAPVRSRVVSTWLNPPCTSAGRTAC